MLIYIGGVLYSLDPPMHIFGGVRTPRPLRESTRLAPGYATGFKVTNLRILYEIRIYSSSQARYRFDVVNGLKMLQ